MKSHNNTAYFTHTLRVDALPFPLLLLITSCKSLPSRRASVSRLPTGLTDIPAGLARPTWPLTQSTTLRANAFTFRNKSRAPITVYSFTSIRALLFRAIFLVPSWVRRLELLREEIHVTLAKLVGATGTARSGAARNIFGVWIFDISKWEKTWQCQRTLRKNRSNNRSWLQWFMTTGDSITHVDQIWFLESSAKGSYPTLKSTNIKFRWEPWPPLKTKLSQKPFWAALKTFFSCFCRDLSEHQTTKD